MRSIPFNDIALAVLIKSSRLRPCVQMVWDKGQIVLGVCCFLVLKSPRACLDLLLGDTISDFILLTASSTTVCLSLVASLVPGVNTPVPSWQRIQQSMACGEALVDALQLLILAMLCGNISLCRTWPTALPRECVPSGQYWWCYWDRRPSRSDR